jgi:hypothetical protein
MKKNITAFFFLYAFAADAYVTGYPCGEWPCEGDSTALVSYHASQNTEPYKIWSDEVFCGSEVDGIPQPAYFEHRRWCSEHVRGNYQTCSGIKYSKVSWESAAKKRKACRY